jgi:hypothetical protein
MPNEIPCKYCNRMIAEKNISTHVKNCSERISVDILLRSIPSWKMDQLETMENYFYDQEDNITPWMIKVLNRITIEINKRIDYERNQRNIREAQRKIDQPKIDKKLREFTESQKLIVKKPFILASDLAKRAYLDDEATMVPDSTGEYERTIDPVNTRKRFWGK